MTPQGIEVNYHPAADSGKLAVGTWCAERRPKKRPRIFIRHRCGNILDITRRPMYVSYSRPGIVVGMNPDCWNCPYCAKGMNSLSGDSLLGWSILLSPKSPFDRYLPEFE